MRFYKCGIIGKQTGNESRIVLQIVNIQYPAQKVSGINVNIAEPAREIVSLSLSLTIGVYIRLQRKKKSAPFSQNLLFYSQ